MCCRDEKNCRQIIDYLVSHQAELISYARKLTYDDKLEDPQDLYQETVYRALSNADKYTDNGTIGSWIYTIMRNIFFNERSLLRHRLKRVDISDIQFSAESITPDLVYESAEVVRAVDRLERGNDRQLMTMWMQGYSYDEISHALDMKLGTVKSSIYRIKHYLRNLME